MYFKCKQAKTNSMKMFICTLRYFDREMTISIFEYNINKTDVNSSLNKKIQVLKEEGSILMKKNFSTCSNLKYVQQFNFDSEQRHVLKKLHPHPLSLTPLFLDYFFGIKTCFHCSVPFTFC